MSSHDGDGGVGGDGADVVLVPYPSQGHVHPMLQFAKRLASHGMRPTLAVTRYILSTSSPSPAAAAAAVRFAAISDGFDSGGFSESDGVSSYLSRLESSGSDTLSHLLAAGGAVRVVVYDAFLPWARGVAARHGAAAVAFFTQPCAVNVAYGHVWRGMVKAPVVENGGIIEMAGLPALEKEGLPWFLKVGPGPYPAYFDMVMRQFDGLELADDVLINSFYELEPKEAAYMASEWRAKTIGPTVPAAYLGDDRIPDDTKYGFHMFELTTAPCMTWLDAHPPRSIVFVSFGSLSNLDPAEMVEVAHALLVIATPFLWAVRPTESHKLPTGYAATAAEHGGMVVTWCPQVEVLAHPSVGCFLTHCGWNSTAEALVMGVPMVALPQWTDQPMNAKYVEDVWRVGVRVRPAAVEGITTRGEVVDGIKKVMHGERSGEYRRNAAEWMEKARKASREGGSSDSNIAEFVAKYTAKKQFDGLGSYACGGNVVSGRVHFGQGNDDVKGKQQPPKLPTPRDQDKNPSAMVHGGVEQRNNIHVVLVPYPSQGHINPVVQFGKRLAAHPGVRCTVAVTRFVVSSTTANPFSGGVHVAVFSDGCDGGGPAELGGHRGPYFERLEEAGSVTLDRLLRDEAESGRAATVVVFDAFVPWARAVARRHGAACAAFLTQSCAVDAVYSHARDGRVLAVPVAEGHGPIRLPGMSVDLAVDDLPTFLAAADTHHPSMRKMLMAQFAGLDDVDHVFVNSFYELEPQEAKYMLGRWGAKTTGPTVPSAFLDGRLPDDASYGFHLHTPMTSECREWLDSQPAGSVVYASFGSIAAPGPEQMAEVADGLYNSGSPFLWVVRSTETHKLPDGFVGKISSDSKRGLIVAWCPQLEVLAHRAVGCFVTHCGWNSTVEALSTGVPMVAVPQWSDQTTNAKYVEDVWRVGVRGRADGEGIVQKAEVERCVREVMEGERSKEFMKNAAGWSGKARCAVSEGGSSDKNIEGFLSKYRLCNGTK
uniref:Deoxynivalenol-UDP-glucosyltransferase n=1 Tax=Leersia perrieri TaxID=77586 RepID=A0A0D9XFQ2_9ORYZ